MNTGLIIATVDLGGIVLLSARMCSGTPRTARPRSGHRDGRSPSALSQASSMA
jgi:hypothetical protein